MEAPDPIFQSVSDEKNFTLAWERVRYFDRKDSRDWLGLKIFASNKDHSLQVLREAFLEDTFEPSYPETKFLPKKSQTLRPMAILSISDRVIYQAIANVVSEQARPLLSMVSNRQSFANVLCEKGSKSMFQPTFRRLTKRILRLAEISSGQGLGSCLGDREPGSLRVGGGLSG